MMRVPLVGGLTVQKDGDNENIYWSARPEETLLTLHIHLYNGGCWYSRGVLRVLWQSLRTGLY